MTNMTYYDELGVDCDVSTEEIRQAYKVMARLLHPDGQTDERLKRMAERQMQRLNGILETLIDPQRRRNYDIELRLRAAQATPIIESPGFRTGRPVCYIAADAIESIPESGLSHWLHAAARHWFWVLIVAAFVGKTALWLATPLERRIPQAQSMSPTLDSGNQLKAVPTAAETEGRRGAAEAAVSNFHQRPRLTPVFAGGPPVTTNPANPDSADEAVTKTIQSQPAAPPREEESAPVEPQADGGGQSRAWRFAGDWVYTPQAGDAPGPGGYPATYAELLLSEEQGDLVGRYRAEHKIPDKAISPEVLLRIRTRAPAGKSVRAEWTSTSGARGIVEMTLRSPEVIDLSWWTTEFGSQRQLTAGSAVLLSQQTP